MNSRAICLVLGSFLTACSAQAPAVKVADVAPDPILRARDIPQDLGYGPSPVGGAWTVLSCTRSTSCKVTIQVGRSNTPPYRCEFAGVPDVIDLGPNSPKIEWTLQSALSGRKFSFGWVPEGYGIGRFPREGIRIRESTKHDEDDGTESYEGPPLAEDVFDKFDKRSDTEGETRLKMTGLQQGPTHRFYFYRIHVEEIDPPVNVPRKCRYHGPMILNRG